MEQSGLCDDARCGGVKKFAGDALYPRREAVENTFSTASAKAPDLGCFCF
jgi:hypothetical protein